MKWLRYWVDTLDKKKIQSLPSVLFKAWVNLLCVARENSGALPPVSGVSFRLRCSEAKAQEWIDELMSRELIDRNASGSLQMHDWKQHQYSSDDSYSRVLKHREKRERNVSLAVSSNVSPSVSVSVSDVFTLEGEILKNGNGRGSDFDKWYAVYWNHAGKQDAKKAFAAAVKECGVEFLIAATTESKARFERTDAWQWRVNMLPATFLRGRRWEDQAAPAVAADNGRPRRLTPTEEAIAEAKERRRHENAT